MDHWILGTNFLRAYYGIFDFEKSQIGFGKSDFIREMDYDNIELPQYMYYN